MLDTPKFASANFRKDFHKSFKAFCKNLPLTVSFILTPAEVFLYERNLKTDQTELLYSHRLNLDKSVFDNIHDIKDAITKFLPVISQQEVTSEPIPLEELEEYMKSDKVDPDIVASMARDRVIAVPWRIETIYIHRDEMRIRNLETDKLYLWKFKSPITLALSHLLQLPATDQFAFLQKKTRVLWEINQVTGAPVVADEVVDND